MDKLSLLSKVVIVIASIFVLSAIRIVVDSAIGFDMSHNTAIVKIVHITTYLVSGGISAIIYLDLLGFIRWNKDGN